MEKFAVGADIGGSHICSCIVNLKTGNIVENSIMHADTDSQDSASAITEIWANTIKKSILAAPDSPIGIGMAFPGPFDYKRGICLIEGVNKFDRIFSLDIPFTLNSRLNGSGQYQIKFINDAGAFALGEALGGHGKGFNRIIALTLGTGVGSGFIINNKLVTGGDDIPQNGWVYHLPFEETIADDAFSTRWFCRRYEELTGTSATNVKEIIEHIESNDSVRTIFREYGERLVDFIIPIANRFKSETIILGGNISRAYPLFKPAIDKRLNERNQKIRIEASDLRDKAALVGAASLFQEVPAT